MATPVETPSLPYGEHAGTCKVTIEALSPLLKPESQELKAVCAWMDAQRELLEELGGPTSIFDDDEEPESDDGVRLSVWRFGSRGLLFASCPGGATFGHGDVVWAAAAFVSSRLQTQGGATALGCRASPVDALSGDDDATAEPPPGARLSGLRVCELGAGAGLPSLAAHWAGATVVMTDANVAGRIATMAASAGLACGALEAAVPSGGHTCNRGGGEGSTTALPADASRARAASRLFVRGHNWGDPCDELVRCGLAEGCDPAGFDLVIVCDCIYNPQFHGALLESCARLVRGGSLGRVVVAFSLHGNVDDEQVWAFFKKAAAAGFEVVERCEEQLPARCGNMPMERSFVHCVCLKKL